MASSSYTHVVITFGRNASLRDLVHQLEGGIDERIKSALSCLSNHSNLPLSFPEEVSALSQDEIERELFIDGVILEECSSRILSPPPPPPGATVLLHASQDEQEHGGVESESDLTAGPMTQAVSTSGGSGGSSSSGCGYCCASSLLTIDNGTNRIDCQQP